MNIHYSLTSDIYGLRYFEFAPSVASAARDRVITSELSQHLAPAVTLLQHAHWASSRRWG
jgi:hypothetical protein